MEARVLNKGDINRTLSGAAANAKKAKKQKNKRIRHTLALPAKQFWPQIPDSDSEGIKTLLNELLPAAKIVCEKNKLKWKALRKMSYEERKAYRQELKKATVVPEDRKFLLVGHRNVSRAVEGNHASCCILSGDVPQIMMTGILSACQHNSIPVIALLELKDITQHTLDFTTTVLAFKKHVSEATDNKFHPIYKLVAELAKQLSPQSDLLHNISEICEESNLKSKTINGGVQTEENCTKHASGKEIKNKETTTKPYKYLYLNADGSRAFVPGKERSVVNVIDSDKNVANKVMDFISLSADGDKNNTKQNGKRKFEESKQDLIGSDDEPEDEEMDIDSMFVIDKQSDAVHPDVSVQIGGKVPANPKGKRQKMLRYFPVSIKTVTSNPAKAVKTKKKQIK